MFGLLLIAAACSVVERGTNASSSQIPSAFVRQKENPSHKGSIRAIDFRNFTYPWVVELVDPAKPNETFTLRNGKRPETRDERGFVNEMGIFLQSISYADVTGDGEEEAIIVLSVLTGGSAIPHCVYIYTLQDDNPKLLWAFSTGDRADGGLRCVYADRGELVVELYGRGRVVGKQAKSLEDQMGLCCPKFFTRTRYRWQGGAFRQVGEATTISQTENHGASFVTCP